MTRAGAAGRATGGRAAPTKTAAIQPCVLLLALLLGACGGGLNKPLLPSGETALSRGLTCAPVGQWVNGMGQPISHAQAIEQAAEAQIVLLGERHGSPTHHLWQFSVAAGILGRKPGMALAFEMLPRGAQRALDRYGVGATDDAGFLKEADWAAVWGFDAQHYLPLFRLGRLHGLSMVAINISRPLARRVYTEGWAGVDPALREGVGDPAAPSPAYRARLLDIFASHPRPAGASAEADSGAAAERFIAAQLLWDRAMAEALAAASGRAGGPVVALVGAEHARLGQGIAHQLADIGKPPPFVMLTAAVGAPCPASDGQPAADALFGITPDNETAR
jgi:uncharacterized iron-regulated protein